MNGFRYFVVMFTVAVMAVVAMAAPEATWVFPSLAFAIAALCCIPIRR